MGGADTTDLIFNSSPEFNVMLITEGSRRWCEVGNLTIVSMPLEELDVLSEEYLQMGKSPGEDSGDEPDIMVMALGSSLFCQDTIRFAALKADGSQVEFSKEFTDRIAQADAGTVIWSDSKTDDLHDGNLIALFVDAKQKGLIS